MARALKFAQNLRELRIHLCQKSDSSKGVREFVEKFYVPLKQTNPQSPILIRECSGIQPRLWARYDMGKEASCTLKNLNSEDVMKQVENLATKC